MKCTVLGIVNNYVISLYGDRWQLEDCGDHFEMYRNIKSLYCAPETNTVL